MGPRLTSLTLPQLLQPLWAHLPLLATCGLLLCYPHPPALDWPQHQAVGGLLAALWRGDPCVTAHYTFVLQPVPYHLLYVVLAPCIAFLGPRWGSACTLIAMACATHKALACWARALGRDPRACALSPLLFFSASFAWGFGPTMMGLPPAMMALAYLGRLYGTAQSPQEATNLAVWAGVWGALAVCAHGVFLPALLLAATPLVFLAGARGCVQGAIFALLCALPALPLATHMWAGLGSTATTARPELTFETAATGWNHLRLYFAAFDRGLSRNAHQALTLMSFAALALGRRRRPLWEFAVAGVAVMHLALVWIMPLNIVMGLTPAPAWLLNVRFLPLFDGALWLLALPRTSQRSWPKAHTMLITVCVATFVVGVGQVFAKFNRAAAYIDVLEHTLPEGTVLPRGGSPQKFAQAWPALERHLTSALVPHPVCVSYNLFVGGHFPIAYKTPEPTPASDPHRPILY